ncbi:hypothetical protein CFIO01_10325 [Colletotrichum fioriniae PJ7]|uniref:Uncharacterized protein n=1 Tax=Colletotrichum fioriniae PJ7 TaxID=1445577 RepID=A0A010RQU9_9PEZI|nr:hypothetical protein CFIO01_10325 [Colletotrichum fioriniae PJ7]
MDYKSITAAFLFHKYVRSSRSHLATSASQQPATLLGVLILASWGALERIFQTSLLVRPSMLVFARELFARSAPTSAWFVDLSSQCDQAYISTLTGVAPVPMRSCVSGGLVPLDAGPSKLSPSSSPALGLIATAAWSSRLNCRLPSDQACASMDT